MTRATRRPRLPPPPGSLAVEEEAFLDLFRALAHGWRALMARLRPGGRRP